jgi:hypothetical protein
MADDVSIRFTADVSDLQKGMQQAASSVDAMTASLRAGATQINAAFAGLSQAYTSNAAQKIASAKSSSDADLAIARQAEQARYDIALNGLSLQSSLIKEQAQTGQMSRRQELASLLASEREREDIEARHLQTLQSMYRQGTLAYATVQRQIDELASQSALRRQQIERDVNQQIYADYRRTFDQIGSSVTNSIMGMIRGHETLRNAAQQVALSIVQSFIAARIKFVADWLAGLAANTTATQAAEAAQTGAVAAGASARVGLASTAAAASNATIISGVLKNIAASANETFAGIFGFLAPVMGPAAAGPAAAGGATVMAVAGGLAVGAWELPSDMIVQAHKGEMVVPAGVTPWAQGLMATGGNGGNGAGGGGTVHVHHATNFSVQAIDASGVRQFLRNNGKQILRAINDGVRTGSHLGLSKLGGSV